MNIDHAAYQAKTKTMTAAELRYTIKDATGAMTANPTGHKAGYYADEVHYCAMELNRRTPVLPEMVECDCGHECGVAMVMSASMGTACPDCYDMMSD